MYLPQISLADSLFSRERRSYILAYLKTKANQQEAKPKCQEQEAKPKCQEEAKPKCQEHGREIILYCESCHECLCSLCSRNEHGQCNIFGLHEEKLPEMLMEKVKCLKKNQEDDRQMLLKTKTDNDLKVQSCIEQIMSREGPKIEGNGDVF